MNGKNLMKRVMAYIIDYTVVMLLVMLITNTKYLNPNYDDALEKGNQLSSLSTSYLLTTNTLPYYFQDKKISEEEYNNLIKDNEYFGYLIVDAYSDKEITEDEYNYIVKTAKEAYRVESKDIYYAAIKANWYTYLIYTIVYFGYFVIFNMITKGISLGKRLTGLKIVSSKGKKVNCWAYLGRSLIAYGYFIYPLEILLPFIVPKEYLGDISSYLSLGVNILQMAVMVSVLYNASGRGLHDYVAGTKVVGINEDILDANVLETKIGVAKDKSLVLKNKEEQELSIDEVKESLDNKEKRTKKITIFTDEKSLKTKKYNKEVEKKKAGSTEK